MDERVKDKVKKEIGDMKIRIVGWSNRNKEGRNEER